MPTQINRINYGVQFNGYSWMRSSQINYQLRLIMDIPQTVLPTENQTQFCDARNPRCQAMNICDTLLGHRVDMNEPLNQNTIQNQTIYRQNICQMMEFVLKRIENTKTTLSLSLATILKDSFHLFDKATQNYHTNDPDMTPSLAETPENLFEELESKLDRSFAAEKMKSAYERTQLQEIQADYTQSRRLFRNWKTNPGLPLILTLPFLETARGFFLDKDRQEAYYLRHYDVPETDNPALIKDRQRRAFIIRILRQAEKEFAKWKTTKQYGEGSILDAYYGQLEDMNPDNANNYILGTMSSGWVQEVAGWLFDKFDQFDLEDIYQNSPQRKRKTRSTIEWETYLKNGEVSKQYVQRYYEQLARYIQNNITLAELFQQDPEDPHIIKDFRPYHFELDVRGWSPQKINEIQQKMRQILNTINYNTHNSHDTFQKLSHKYDQLLNNYNQYCWASEAKDIVTPFYKEYVCKNMFLVINRFSDITNGMKQLYTDRIEGLSKDLNHTSNNRGKRDTQTTHSQRKKQKRLDQMQHDFDEIKTQTDQLHFQLDQIEANKQTILTILTQSKIKTPVKRDITGKSMGILDPVFKGIGKGFGNIFGLATTSQLNDLLKTQEELYENQLQLEANIVQFRTETAANFALTAAAIEHVGTMVTIVNDKVNNIAHQLGSRINLNLKFTTWSVTTLASVIQDVIELRNQLDRFVSALRELRSQRLSPNLISETDLDNVLQQLASKLRRESSLYKIVHTSLGWYYQNAKPTFTRINDQLLITIFIPLSSRRERYYMYTVNTFEIPAPGQPHLYTYLNNDVEVFGINKEQTQFIEMSMSDWQSCKAYSSQHCKKATKTYDIKYPTCLTALFKGDKLQIKELCQFKLEQKPLRPNLIAAAQELIIINAETLVNQCTTPKGTETTVEEGCHMCIKPKHCNCVYIAQSPLGSVTLAPDMEQCTTFSHEEQIKFPVNLAKMQYLWSKHYLKNLSEQVIEKVNKIPEAPFHIDDSQFEHALNRHYDFSIDLAKAAKKAKKNVKLYPIKRLPASTWQLDKMSEFFTLANTLSFIAILLSTATLIFSILMCRQMNTIAYKVYLMSISAQTTYVRAERQNETTIFEKWMTGYNTLEPINQFVFLTLILLTITQITLLIIAITCYHRHKPIPRPYAKLDVIIKRKRKMIRITVLKIDCQPNTLRQTARKGVSDVKLKGSTFSASMVMKWHNRTISCLTSNNVIKPPTEIRLTVLQGLKLKRILWSSYLISSELVYYDDKGKKTVRSTQVDRPRSVFVRYSRWETETEERERLQREYEYQHSDDQELTTFH